MGGGREWQKPWGILEGRDSLEDLDKDGRWIQHCVFNVECVEVDCTDRGRAAVNMANTFWAAKLRGMLASWATAGLSRKILTFAWWELRVIPVHRLGVRPFREPCSVIVWSLKPIGHYMYHQFNIKQFYVLSTQCIYVFCVDLRTNSYYFPIQH